MVNPFPPIPRETARKGDEDYNPAIRLFGRRFFGDQTVPELLLELLLVATSSKRIGDHHIADQETLPGLALLRSWPAGKPLEYAPRARLNLKLFAFINASKLDTRHETHRQHYGDLVNTLAGSEHLVLSGAMEPMDVIKTLENLFLGFQSVGGQRTWCAQAFLPVAKGFVAGESIWKETKARRELPSNWHESVRCFSHNQQIFLARSGELLYLQLCNALRQDAVVVESWLSAAGVGASAVERHPEQLHAGLQQGLADIFRDCPDTVDRLAEFIDSGIDPDTPRMTDSDRCRAVIDPIERLELLEIACAMQVLRSLCAQAARQTERSEGAIDGAGPSGYVWAISDPLGRETAVKQISRRNVNAVQRMIYDSIRHPTIREGFPGKDQGEVDKAYHEADRHYGHKLFLTLAKRLGLVVPRRGAGARFVLNERLLRYLVLSTIRPGERVTYDSFKRLLFAHYGLAIDDESIGRSCFWSGTSRLTTLGGHVDDWLVDMLDAAGMLIRLSDSCSLVVNSFGTGETRA